MDKKILMGCMAATVLAIAPLCGFSAQTSQSTQQTPMHKFAQFVDDSTITAQIKALLMDDAGLKSFDITVKTYNGKVQLSGFVDSQEDIQNAVEKAKSVDGVQSVVNSLQVKD